MEQNSSCKANRSSASQEIPPILRNLEFRYFFQKRLPLSLYRCRYIQSMPHPMSLNIPLTYI